MESDQLIKRIQWIEEDRRKEKDSISSVENRVVAVEGALKGITDQLKQLSSEITHLASVLTRMDQFDGNLLQQRLESKRSVEELEKDVRKRAEETERQRVVEIRALDTNIADLRKELEALPRLEKGIQVRVEEESRLRRSIDEMGVRIEGVRRDEEEYTRTYRLLEDGRRQDAKRITDLQGEVAALRKFSDSQRGQIEVVNTTQRRIDTRLNELVTVESERRDAMSNFLDKQAMSQVERERTWKDWQARFETIERQAGEIESQLVTLDATHRETKRAQTLLEELSLKVERRLNELTEVQRLSEDRFRQEWVTFKADDQKRWTNYTLTQEEQRSEMGRQFERLDQQINQSADGLQEMQDLYQQVNELSEKRLQSLLALAHEWNATYERTVGEKVKVIGTAGHVDHGKSTLVQALTGTHPDRLKEEREREMTIDLGFAWLELGGEEVGIVDVPGHRDFIENMLAGVGGIDAALFVIAADEGIMPQTREHLAILDLLQIQGGVIALTKIDMLDDPEWLDLIEEDVRGVLAGTVLDGVSLVRVSARTGAGIPALKVALTACLAERPPRPDLRRPRLPVDRVFTMPGFGTVVTGTLSDGRLKVGEDVEILPARLRGRVRGLQTHKHKEDEAVPGGRTAVNISGVNLDQVLRGDVIAHPGTYRPTGRMDVRFRLLGDVSQALKHNDQVKFFIGASEVVARVRLLGVEALEPGQEGWLQLELSQPVVAVRGDRYILRRPSPGETLGGGSVIDPAPKGRHKRFASDVLARLEALAQGTPAEVLLQALTALGLASLQEALTRSSLDQPAAESALAELIETGQIVNFERRQLPFQKNDLVTSLLVWDQLSSRAVGEVSAYHKAYPLRAGLPREELRSRLGKGAPALPPRLFPAVYNRLAADGLLAEAGPLVKLPGHTIQLNLQQQAKADVLLAKFTAAPYAPPSVKECQAEVGDEVFAALVDTGRLVAVSPEVAFRLEDYERMRGDVLRLIEKQGAITAAEVRDHFNTSRRYVLALLEHFDAVGVTLRDGDVRRKGRSVM